MTSGHAGREPEGGGTPAPGQAIGPYRLVELLGRGGMGEVWRADDPTGAAGGAPRPVAVKLLAATLAADPSSRARFAREVAALRRVASPHVAPLLDADPDAPRPWLASAYVAGPSLADHVARHGPVTGPALRALGAAMAEALAAIHAAGVVHRDLTPRNVVLGPDGPRVVDFGIAWFPGAVPVTQAGSAMGTPTWMAPERVARGEATAAADVWSWGAVMAYASQGASPDGPPDWLAPWVRAATAADPAARPPASVLVEAMAGRPDPWEATTRGDPAPGRGPGTTVPATPRRPADARAADARTVPAAPRAGIAGAPTPAPRDRRVRSRLSGAILLVVAAAVGFLTGVLGAILVGTALVLLAVLLRHRRVVAPAQRRPTLQRGPGGDVPPPGRSARDEAVRPRVPPTWAVALAGPAMLGAALTDAIGVLPGLGALAVLLVVFFVLAGDAVTG
ncbi:MAG TPA: serine/threonine-protein kinase [Acidimicrobiales bacterium]|nr:serine/threonine-protein kinase [Acidimicrobiales bacterium]